MFVYSVLFLATFIQSSSDCPCADQIPSNPLQNQEFTGLEDVVKNLQAQIETLAKENQKKAWLMSNLNSDEQVAVVDLSDSMVDNVLLTRVYLALAIAEMKLIPASERAGLLSELVRTKYLRHIQAIQLAIDERILDGKDLRVYRALQGGVNQALRRELERMLTKRSQQDQPMVQIASSASRSTLPIYSYPSHPVNSNHAVSRTTYSNPLGGARCGVWKNDASRRRGFAEVLFRAY